MGDIIRCESIRFVIIQDDKMSKVCWNKDNQKYIILFPSYKGIFNIQIVTAGLLLKITLL